MDKERPHFGPRPNRSAGTRFSEAYFGNQRQSCQPGSLRGCRVNFVGSAERNAAELLWLQMVFSALCQHRF